MPYCWALDLVTLDTFFTVRVRARSNAKRMMRSQPFSVNSAVCRATSLPGPRPLQVASAQAGVFAFAVLPDDDPVQSVSSALRSGRRTPGRNFTGRMLAHWSKFWVMFSRRPHRLMWSGTLGQPTAPK